MVPMISHTASRGVALLAAFAIALAVGLALTMPTQAFADDAALTVSTLADDNATIVKTKTSYTWVKAGKKLFSWGNYEKKKLNGTLRPRETMSLYNLGWDYAKDDYSKPANLKSSNASIIKPVVKIKYGYTKYVSKKFGNATVTFTLNYTNEKGKAITEKVTEKHKVVKYACPIASFKIGSKDYTAKFKKVPQARAKSALEGKLAVKAAKGWTIKKIRQVNSAITSGEFVPQKKLSNGSNVKIAKDDSSAIEVICYNKKGAYYSSVILTPNFLYETIAG